MRRQGSLQKVLVELQAMVADLGPGTGLLGLDVGRKTIGVAVCDGRRIIASPLDTVRRSKLAADAGRLAIWADEYGTAGLVIGLPLGMDGREGPSCQSMRQFAKNLHGHLGLAYAFWDERLSTAAIERLLVDEADMTRRRRAQVVDKMAAAYILQGALDALAAGGGNALAAGRDDGP
jgi:putative Holliday junction resolvase